ncbi:MAG TPA: hypothetical protein VMA35_11115 [Candidatus Sulfopaludibacter sp.]|nr:hypothetical protein [Candidatus Sulfopaludibacter sp.]
MAHNHDEHSTIGMKNDPPSDSQTGGLLQSGIIFAVMGFLATGIHYIFQAIISPQLGGTSGEYGLVLATLAFVGFLGLPLTIAVQAVTHYIARFHFSGDDARLHGLLAGCQKFLFQVTIAGSVLAVILVKPLGDFFHIPRISLTLIALVCVLGSLWASYATALCQGLGWFKRLAFIGLLAAVLRVLFGGLTTRFWPVAECAVAASAVMLLANLILLFWRKEFPRRTNTALSPWTPEFKQFLVVSAAWGVGSNCLIQGDLLVANKFFAKGALDAYGSAGLFARALPTAVAPLLTVLFTHRSRRHHHDDDTVREQLKLMGLYAAGLVAGAICLILLSGFCLQLLHRNTPEAVAMIGPLAVTMVFVGLQQSLAYWALASRWIKISLLYGVLGLGYWLILFAFGRTPAALLQTMPIAAAGVFGVLLVFWWITMQRHHSPRTQLP